MTKRKKNIVNLFESRKGNLEARVMRDYVNNGIATIPCRISDYHDVISPYAVENYETPNTEFLDYVKTCAEVIPPECPIVVSIVEDCLSEKEKKTVSETIREYFAYYLGVVEKEERRHTKIFVGMTVGLLVSGILLYLSQILEEVPREFFFVLFWFIGDTLCDYIFLTGHDLRHDRRLAGRLASMKVEFARSFDESDYSKEEVDRIYSDIEEDVKKTRKTRSDT